MDRIEDYRVGKCLHSGRRTVVYAGVRREDRIEVVLKSYSSAGACPRAEREFAALRRAAGPGIAVALELIEEPPRVTLVLTRAPGISLHDWVTDRGPLSAPAFSAVALQLAHALTLVHAARLIHCGVTPHNILVDVETFQTTLVGFGRVQTLGASSDGERTDQDAGEINGDLLYISPESSGRMDRGIDSRSDLYSLGATFFFALTGQPPFPGEDPLALIHAHMARRPTPPQELRPDSPATLSRIVMRLLQKSPEERYQRAEALQHDLKRCNEALARTGTIQDDFPLGSADAPYRPLFSKRLHGRIRESAALIDSYRTAAAGETVVLLLQGAPGVGKSSLIHELRPLIAESGGHLAGGKFDLYRREQPYLGITEALRDLTQQLLTESDARLTRWRNALRDAVGTGAGALTELVPELGFVLGDVSPATALGPMETRLRLGLALQRFVQVLSAREHPLVIFIDDLQWADAGSRELLSDLILDPTPRALLLLCAFRDTEANAHYPLHRFFETLRNRGVRLSTIELLPLGEEACAEMLAEALGRTPVETLDLARCVARKTGNVPLLIQQFVHHIHDEGLIHFHPKLGWTWDDAQLAAAEIPEGAVEFLSAKISRLPHGVAGVLELASCVGNSFDLDLLTELSDRPRAQVELALFALCDEGLIAPVPQGFRFVHDRIREAAQALISPQERARLHGQAAELLLAHTPASGLDERIFEIVDHLNEARTCGLGVIERERRLELDVRACRRALAAGAGETALHYFSAGEAEFDAALWETHATLAFDLFLQGADAAHQCEWFDEARRCLELLAERPLGLLQKIQVDARQIRTSSVTQPRLATVDLTRRLLRRYGIRWPRTPSWLRVRWEVLRTDWSLGADLGERTLRQCPPENIERVLPVLLIAAAGQSLSMTSHRMILIGTSQIVRTYLTDGFNASPGFALAAYAAYRLRFSGDWGSARRCVAAARCWTERVPHVIYSLRAEMVALGYVDAWLEPRHRLLEPLQRVGEAASEAGDFEYACLTEAIRGGLVAMIGAPLSDFEEMIDRTTFTQWAYAMSVPYAMGARVFAVLRTGEDVEQVLSELHSAYDAAQDVFVHLIAHLLLLLVLLVLDDFERAFDEAERLHEPMSRVQLGTHVADFEFLRGVAAARRAGASTGARRRAARRVLRQSVRALRRWAVPGSDFVHMHQLLRAETLRLRGDARAALSVYVAGTNLAQTHEHRHHAALAHERRASLLLELGRATEARSALRQAMALYEEWGTPVKAKRIAHRLAKAVVE